MDHRIVDFTQREAPVAASNGSGQDDVAKGLLEPGRLRWKHFASTEGVYQSLKQHVRAGRNALCDSVSVGPALKNAEGQTQGAETS